MAREGVSVVPPGGSAPGSASISPRRSLGRAVVALASWVLAASIVEVVVGAEMAARERLIEQRLELQLLGKPAAAPAPRQPERSRDEPLDPSELVNV